MSYLAQLAQGLRSAAGVLNPEIQKQNFEQEQLQEQQKARQAQFLVQQVAAQVQNGAMAPEVAAAALRSRGINAPVEMFGPSADVLAKQQTLKNEQAFRGAIASLSPEERNDPEKVASLAMQYGKPEIATSLFNASEGRKSREQATAAMLEQRKIESDRAHEVRLAQARTAEERAAEIARHNLATERLAQAIAANRPARQEPAPTITEIADPSDPTKSIKIDARTGRKIGDAAPRPATEKALTGPLQKQLTEAAELADATQRFKSTFKDDYAGDKITAYGNAKNILLRKFGDESGRAQWWQDYELHQSQIRNKLFGSALTATEVAAWNKSAIDPGMDPKQIKLNLERRNELEQKGIDRLLRGAAAGGYKKEQIEAFTGRSVPESGAGGGWSIQRKP